MMKLWVDDIREAPSDDYIAVRSVNEAIDVLSSKLRSGIIASEINIDHDSGDFFEQGGDYINVLDWLAASYYPMDDVIIVMHSMNPVGVENMIRICERNEWTYKLM